MDSDAFTRWILTHRVGEELVPAMTREAEAISALAAGGPVMPKHVAEALRRREAQGASAQELALVQRAGDALVELERASNERLPALSSGRPGPLSNRPPPVSSAAPASSGARAPSALGNLIRCTRCKVQQPVPLGGAPRCTSCGAAFPELLPPPKGHEVSGFESFVATHKRWLAIGVCAVGLGIVAFGYTQFAPPMLVDPTGAVERRTMPGNRPIRRLFQYVGGGIFLVGAGILWRDFRDRL